MTTRSKTPNPPMTAASRRLRRQAPVPERLLWSRLRNGQLAGLKFRRQHAVEPYIVDFYCHRLQLAIEIDGMSHMGRSRQDADRQRCLEQHGLHVIRFTNDDVLKHLDSVVDAIYAEAMRLTSHSAPSPREEPGEGGFNTPLPSGGVWGGDARQRKIKMTTQNHRPHR